MFSFLVVPGYALIDASKAIEIDKMYLKAYYRRAAAYMSLGKYKMALKDYERVYKVRPNDSDAKAKFTECKKIVNQVQSLRHWFPITAPELQVFPTISYFMITLKDHS